MEARATKPTVGQEFAVVFAGGVVGALGRASLAQAFTFHADAWPWATFIANVAGCIVLSWVITHTRINGGPSLRVALVGTGFCGALTTFSTLQVELYTMLDLGEYGLAATYAAASILAGTVVVAFTRRAVERGRDLA